MPIYMDMKEIFFLIFKILNLRSDINYHKTYGNIITGKKKKKEGRMGCFFFF
jgi:hypothetical protein